jgi:GlpG protein
MRQIGTLPDEAAARKLADYLLTQKIETKLEPGDGWEIWVCDEDHVEQARAELRQFLDNPSDARYEAAAPTAAQIREEEERKEKRYRKNFVDLGRNWDRVMLGRMPLTLALIAVSLVVAGVSRLGAHREPVLDYLFISSFVIEDGMIRWPRRSPILEGQAWRLVTPIFIHLGILHLLFNMYMLYALGGPIERLRGTWRMGLLVLACAVLSNLAQYWWSQHPYFGGMSGVNYGLFGYAWMKGRYEPESGLTLHPQTIVILMAWLVLCMLGVVGGVANAAHVAGLVVGAAVGVRRARPP